MPQSQSPSEESVTELLNRVSNVWASQQSQAKSVSLRGSAIQTALRGLALSSDVAGKIYRQSLAGSSSDSDPEAVSNRLACLIYPAMDQLGLGTRSLLLALQGGYNAGYTLLRSRADLAVRSVVQDHLAVHLREELAKANRWDPRFHDQARASGLLAALDRLRPQADRLKREPLDFLLETVEEFDGIPFRDMSSQLGLWGLALPIRDLYDFVDYASLNKNVHAGFFQLDFSRAVDHLLDHGVASEAEEDAAIRAMFFEGSDRMRGMPVFVETLDDYLAQFNRVSEMAAVLTLHAAFEWSPHRHAMTDSVALIKAKAKRVGFHSLAQAADILARRVSS